MGGLCIVILVLYIKFHQNLLKDSENTHEVNFAPKEEFFKLSKLNQNQNISTKFSVAVSYRILLKSVIQVMGCLM
jgi:hypothetical protein